MALWLKALVSLAKDVSSISSTRHGDSQKPPVTPVSGDLKSFWLWQEPVTHMVHILTCSQNIHTHSWINLTAAAAARDAGLDL